MASSQIFLRANAAPVYVSEDLDVIKTLYVQGGTVSYGTAVNAYGVLSGTTGTITSGSNLLLDAPVWLTANGITTVNIVEERVPAGGSGGGGGGSGHTIEDEGSALTARTSLNFTGAGVTAADSGGKTVVTIAGKTIVSAGSSGASASQTVTADEEVWRFTTLTANHTLTVTMAARSVLRLFGTQDATGSRTLTISDGTTSTAVTVPGTANAAFEVELYCDGTTVYINAAGASSSVPAFDPNWVGPIDPHLATTSTVPGANAIRAGRFRVPITGTLKDFYVFVQTTVNGAQIKAALYDHGITTTATRTKLWESAAATTLTGASTGYMSLGDPNMAVTAGQYLDAAIITDNAGVALSCAAGLNSSVANMPTALAGGMTTAPKLGWTNSPGSFAFFSTLADGSGPTSSPTIFLMLMRII